MCPLPVLRANRVLRLLQVGDEIEVWATDPAARKDFPEFCRVTGHRLNEIREEEGDLIFLITKA